jgi:nitrate reductase gamma subunit
MDGIVLFVLLIQLGSGVGVAIFNRWGGLWYLDTAVPWFWSLVALHPET